MTDHTLEEAALRLERQIERASQADRLSLRPRFEAVLTRLKAQGRDVPARMRSLNAALAQEAAEARFDNMPI